MEKLLSLLLSLGSGIVIMIDQGTMYIITASLLFVTAMYGLKGALFQ